MESNAIGTAYLRAQMLPESVREHTRKLLRDYTDQRVRAGAVTTVDEAAFNAARAMSARTQTELWDQARRSVSVDPNPATSGLFVQALNEVFDQFGKRDASLDRHVPELVLLLLYATFLLAGATIGYSAGVAAHRPQSFVTYIMAALILAVVFLILDLDRPRRGLIQVSQEPMTSLQGLDEGRCGTAAAPIEVGHSCPAMPCRSPSGAVLQGFPSRMSVARCCPQQALRA